MRAHIEDVLAGSDEGHADYIIKWTAWSLQNPATPPGVALVFRGGQGVGKGIYANAMVDVFGKHGMSVQNMVHLTGKFNAHLRHTCLLFADEAVRPNNDDEGAMKGLITEPIPIEAKGVDVINAPNHLHVIMATNNEFVVRSDPDVRRYAVFDVSDEKKGDKAYFDTMGAQMNNGGMAAMLHDLLYMDLADFNPEHDRPDTDALTEQRDLSLSKPNRVIHNLLRAGELPCLYHVASNRRVFVPTRLLLEAARLDKREETALGAALAIISEPVAQGKRKPRRSFTLKDGAHQLRGGYLLPLQMAREAWENYIGYKTNWPDDDNSWVYDLEEQQDEGLQTQGEPDGKTPF